MCVGKSYRGLVTSSEEAPRYPALDKGLWVVMEALPLLAHRLLSKYCTIIFTETCSMLLDHPLLRLTLDSIDHLSPISTFCCSTMRYGRFLQILLDCETEDFVQSFENEINEYVNYLQPVPTSPIRYV